MTTPARRAPRLLAVVVTGALVLGASLSAPMFGAAADEVYEPVQPTVSLHVVDEQGDPIPGIRLSKFTLDDETGEFEAPEDEDALGTNEQGEYSTTPGPGSYKYFISDHRDPSFDDTETPQDRPQNYDSEWFDDSSTEAGATVVTIAEDSGEQRVLEVVLTEHTGAPTLLGALTVEPDADDPTRLVASHPLVSPASATVTHQWLRDGAIIDGATGDDYELTPDDAGTSISLQLTATTDGTPQNTAVFESNPFEVAALPFEDAPDPTISGEAVRGETLVADPKDWTPTPATRSYQWFRDGEAIDGETGLEHILSSEDVGSEITFSTTGQLAHYTPTTRTSAPTAAVLDVFASPTTIPAPTGDPVVGQVLTAVTGDWSPLPNGYEYQWVRLATPDATASTPIDGATAATYTLTAADIGSVVAVQVVALKNGFDAPDAVRSLSTTVVLDVFTPPSAIPAPTGTTHKGQTLTAVTGSWNPNADSYEYQWVRAETVTATEVTVIDGATSNSYTLGAADVGNYLAVRIVAVKNGFATSSAVTSAGSAVVLDVFAVEPLPAVAVPAPSGTTKYGETLTVPAPTSAVSPAAQSVTYRWVRKRAPDNQGFIVIPDATGTTYQTVDADKNQYIAVELTLHRTGFADVKLVSVSSTKIAPLVFSATPNNLAKPSGQAVFGHTLTAVTGTWSPAPSGFTYEWHRDNGTSTVIAGATNSSYQLTLDDIGSIVWVIIYPDAPGYDFTRTTTSATTETVVAADFDVEEPQIVGAPFVGQKLEATPGTPSPEPVNISYTWLRGTTVVQSGREPYALTAADVGEKITFRVAASRPGYTTSVTTDVTAEVKPAPTFTTVPRPTISGTARVGSTLSLSRGTWAPSSTVTYSYQWSASGVPIEGATASKFVPQAAQRGKTISVKVTGTLQYGETRTSAASKSTAFVAYGKITGKTPSVSGTSRSGKTVTASVGTWSPSGLTFSYTWLRNGKAISGATARSYVLTGSDYKKKISVRVKGSQPGYTSVTKTSSTRTISIGALVAPKPLISGPVAVSSKITATTVGWGPATVTKSYQWYANGKAISKAKYSTYTIPSSLKGKKISVKVTGKKSGFTTVSVTSASSTVTAALP